MEQATNAAADHQRKDTKPDVDVAVAVKVTVTAWLRALLDSSMKLVGKRQW